MYYNEDGVAQYEVENIANVTVASAFTTLAPTATDGSEMVDITTTGYDFQFTLISIDNIGRVGFAFNKLFEPIFVVKSISDFYPISNVSYENPSPRTFLNVRPTTSGIYHNFVVKNEISFKRSFTVYWWYNNDSTSELHTGINTNDPTTELSLQASDFNAGFNRSGTRQRFIWKSGENMFEYVSSLTNRLTGITFDVDTLTFISYAQGGTSHTKTLSNSEYELLKEKPLYFRPSNSTTQADFYDMTIYNNTALTITELNAIAALGHS
jgi:hypothetical protein